MIKMDWIKKHWIAITVGVVILAIIIWYVVKNKKNNQVVVTLPKFPKLSKIPFTAFRSPTPTPVPVAEKKATKAELQKQYDDCMVANKNYKGRTPPCAVIEDMLNKAESGYFMQGDDGISKYYPDVFGTGTGLNIGAYAIGLQGTGLERGMWEPGMEKPENSFAEGAGELWGDRQGKADLKVVNFG
jgi:hypothetical protein